MASLSRAAPGPGPRVPASEAVTTRRRRGRAGREARERRRRAARAVTAPRRGTPVGAQSAAPFLAVDRAAPGRGDRSAPWLDDSPGPLRTARGDGREVPLFGPSRELGGHGPSSVTPRTVARAPTPLSLRPLSATDVVR